MPFVESNRDRLIKKWGGIQGWERQKRHHNLKGRGQDAGIPHFNLDRLAANTMASHRLIQYIGKKYGLSVSEALYDELNTYYFVNGHSLNDKPRLANVASQCLARHVNDDSENEKDHVVDVMTEDQILKFLNGEEGRKEIENALKALSDMGVHSIPKFVIEGRTIVDGAAKSDVFVEIFRQIEEKGEVYGGPLFGDILGVGEDIVRRPSHKM
jgi:predicted DsbA family dithiol-disulfide isomerase